MLFLALNDEPFKLFIKLFKKITSKKDCNILKIKNNHGTKFENLDFEKFCSKNEIDHNFSAPKITSIKWDGRNKE